MEWTLLVSVVQSSTAKIREALHISNILIESCFGSLFSYFGLQVMDIIAEEEGDIIIDLYVLVLNSSMSSTQNLFTRGNWSILFTSCIIQNPLLLKDSLLWKLHFLKPRDLLLVSPIVLLLTALCPSSKDSPLPDSLHLYTCNIYLLAEEVFGLFCYISALEKYQGPKDLLLV